MSHFFCALVNAIIKESVSIKIKKMAKIGIDARFYGTSGKGLGRYTQKLIENLERVDDKNTYFVFLRKNNFNEFSPQKENFKKVLADFKWYGFSEQFFYPFLLRKYKLDIVHFPHFNVPILYRKKIIITIHDLILLHFPTLRGTTLNPFFYWIKFFAYKIVINSAIRRAKKVITVSNFTKRDILKNYNIPEGKIVVTYESCDDFCRFSPEGEGDILDDYGLSRDEHGIIKPYILYVGNAYPHKNLERLVRSFEVVGRKRKNLYLVLVGKRDHFYEKVVKEVKEKDISNVIFTGYVKDGDLDILYRRALAYVFPSLYEGFGLPPLEAMAKGLPVISSNHECMREILGDSAYYFDANNEENIAEAVLHVISEDSLMRDLSRKGYERLTKYSWKRMANDTLAIYENEY